MKLINLKSKKGIVNLFADFILNKFNKNKNTVIEVSDFNHFFIINGRTSSNNVIDLSKVRDEFVSEYQDLLNTVGYGESINIMDLITYDDKNLKKRDSIWFDYFDSERPIFNHKIINHKFDNQNLFSIENEYEVWFDFKSESIKYNNPTIQITSEFPYGHSLSMGRKLMYYGEYIVYNIKNSLICDKISLKISENKNEEGEQEIDVLDESLINDSIKSVILDSFDFNFNLFQQKFEAYNFCEDILNQTSKKPWLIKDINTKDLVIL